MKKYGRMLNFGNEKFEKKLFKHENFYVRYLSSGCFKNEKFEKKKLS
jgi:hypothetical protein